jgi:hypothetical protein
MILYQFPTIPTIPFAGANGCYNTPYMKCTCLSGIIQYTAFLKKLESKKGCEQQTHSP